VVEPLPRLQPSTPPKPILSEEIVSGSNKAEARSRIQRTITEAELIEDPEVAKEHMLVEVPNRKLSSNGHMSVRDW
jgi:hypothetical protein